jgi:hypothetical protein
MNYEIVLFKNKEKKKIIKKFITLDRAKAFYNKLIKESDSVIFNKKTENGNSCEFELGLLKKGKTDNTPIFIKDDLGRNIKVELDNDNYTVLKIQKYNIEELFVDYKTKNKINTKQLIELYLKGLGLKMVSKLNNKIVIQNDEKINLFTFKTESDSLRFTNRLTEELTKLNKKDCIIVNDYSIIHRKYLYTLLENYGFSKEYLQTYSTTYHSKK